MKTIRLLSLALVVLGLALVGCKKNGVDTKPLEKSFATAEAPAKASSDKAVAAVKAGNYSEAMAELGKLAQNAKLTPEQQSAVKDTIEQVKTQLAQKMEKAGEDMNKAAGDLQKSLPK